MQTRHAFLGIFVLTVLTSGCGVQAKSLALTGTFERTLTVSGPVDLQVLTGSGRIQVRRGGDGQVRVIGRIRASDGWFSDVSAADMRALEADPPIVQNGDSINLGRLPRAVQNVSISYEITVPANTRLKSRTGSGSHDIDSIHGPVDASAGSGRIRMGKIESVVMARAGSGSIDVLGARGGDFKTGSGSIRVSGASEALRAHAGSGSITLEGELTKDWQVQTGSGGITVRLPGNAAFDLDARSSSRIHVGHPIESPGLFHRRHVAGRIRGGGPRLTISAGSGSIRVD